MTCNYWSRKCLFLYTCLYRSPEAICFIPLYFYFNSILTLWPCVITQLEGIVMVCLSHKYHTGPLYWWHYDEWSIWAGGSNNFRLVGNQRMGNKSNWNSRTFNLSEILSPVVWAMRDIPSKEKEKLLHLAPPTIKKDTEHLGSGGIWIWRQHIPHLGVLLWPIYQVTQKVLCGAWNRRRLFKKSRLLCRLLSNTQTIQSSRFSGTRSVHGR